MLDLDAVVANQRCPAAGRPERQSLVLRARVGKGLVEAAQVPELVAADAEIAGGQKVGLEAVLAQRSAVGLGLKVPVEGEPVAAERRLSKLGLHLT